MSGFDWRNYLELATRLSSGNDEATLRTAVSRAYYYVFHIALERAENNAYIAPRLIGSHEDLWRLYENNPLHECKKLAALGRRLKDGRVLADYKSAFPQLERSARDAITDAKDFAKILARLDPRHPKQLSQRH